MDRNTNKQMEEMLSPDDMMMPQEPPTPEAIAEGKQTAKEIFFESFPGVSEAASIGRVKKELEEKDYVGAGIETAAGLVGVLPLVGDIAAKGISKTAKALRKEDAELADKLLKDETAFEGWKKENKVRQEQKRVPEVQEAAQALTEGKITSKDYRHIVKGNQPIRPITSDNFPDLPTKAEIVGALKATDPRKVDTGVIGLNKSIKDGTRVGSRLDIPAYEKYDKWIVSLHDGTKRGGNAIGYGQTAVLTDVEFITSAKGGVGIAKGKPKTTIARIHGDYQNAEPENVFEAAKRLINDPEWTQVGMNPFRHSYFYDKATGNPVTKADEVIQVGPLVLAKGVKKPTLSEMKELVGGTKVVKDGKVTYKGAVRTEDGKIRTFNEGGMAIEKQMEMFEDGGLKDEGGTIDPVSGNDVPPGSTQEEVRDDIPAQLSEGEFVFPADVVRYWGLDTLMRMRQQAKMGLRMMEEMGQMGNSEEATIPDDIPFDINDLDMDDEPEYNVGGFVPGTQQDQQMGIAGYQAAPMPTTSYATQPIQAASQQFVQPVTRPAQAYVPTQQVPTPMPTFGEITGPGVPEVDFEFATFRNEAGQEIQLRIKKGSRGELLPGEVLPEGYSWVDPTATTTEEVTTTPTAVETTMVTDSGDGDERRRQEEEAKYGPGGGRIGLGGYSDGTGRKKNATLVGVSFGMPDGFIPGAMGAIGTAAGLLSGEGIPKGATATFFLDGETVTVDAETYNSMKAAGFTGDASDSIISQLKESKRLSDRSKDMTRDFMSKSKEEREKETADAVSANEARIRARTEKAEEIATRAAEIKAQQAKARREMERAQIRQDIVSSETVEEANRKTQEREARQERERQEDRDSGGSGQTFQEKADDYTAERVAEFQSTDFSGRGFAEGGLASRPKPKAKKMKRGGLASKK